MGVSIQEWRAKIGCNKSLYRNKNLYQTSESLLASSTSSTRSRHAAGVSSLILILALTCSSLNPMFQKLSAFTSDSKQQFNSFDQSKSDKVGVSGWLTGMLEVLTFLTR